MKKNNYDFATSVRAFVCIMLLQSTPFREHYVSFMQYYIMYSMLTIVGMNNEGAFLK